MFFYKLQLIDNIDIINDIKHKLVENFIEINKIIVYPPTVEVFDKATGYNKKTGTYEKYDYVNELNVQYTIVKNGFEYAILMSRYTKLKLKCDNITDLIHNKSNSIYYIIDKMIMLMCDYSNLKGHVYFDGKLFNSSLISEEIVPFIFFPS